MRIHCDRCGAEIRKEDAVAWHGDEEVLWFCSQACLEEMDYHETMSDPGRDEDAAPTDVR